MASKPLVFLEISIDGVKMPGQILLELFDKEAPMTAANFRKLCTGGADIGCYKGSSFHRAIPDYMCCGGDFIRGNGTGIGSIYGDKFPVVERSDPHRYKSPFYKGLLVTGHPVPTAQAPYTCGPKFMLTTVLKPHLARQHPHHLRRDRGWRGHRQEHPGCGHGKRDHPEGEEGDDLRLRRAPLGLSLGCRPWSALALSPGSPISPEPALSPGSPELALSPGCRPSPPLTPAAAVCSLLPFVGDGHD